MSRLQSTILMYLLALLLFPSGTYGLAGDRNQPINIEADSAEFDEKSGTSIYRGNVRVTQGSLSIAARIMTVYKKANGNLLVAEGNPAHFRQRPEGERQDVVADARRMEYTTSSDKLLLTGDARIEQSGNIFTSQRIVYDMTKNHVQAGRSPDSVKQSTDKSADRVHIIIQPQKPAGPPETTAPMSTLQAQNLIKRIGNRTIVNQVSLEVNSGEVVGLLGPNGAGKTTCFYMIVGLISCDAGYIEIGDKDVTAHATHVRARHGLGYLPQEPSVFRKLSVEDNIRAILELQPQLNRTERESRLETLLEEFHIGHLRGQSGISLSGGERRRVEIARALATDPGFILLDEPFAGVDPISVLDIQGIIRQLRDRKIGVLITDHNVRETLGICERAYILNAGRVIAAGDPESILHNQVVRDVYLGQEFRL